MHVVALSQDRQVGVEFADDALVRPESTDALWRALERFADRVDAAEAQERKRPDERVVCPEEMLNADRIGALLGREAVPGFQVPEPD